mgnify:CR=1 FL=1
MGVPLAGQGRRRRWAGVLALLLALVPCVTPASAAGQDGLTQSRIEAVYLYKFASFVTWPASAFDSPASPIVVGVYNDPALVEELRTVAAGKQVNGRPLRVRALDRDAPADGLHILFLGKASNGRAAALLEAVAGGAVLTVSDDPSVHARGTMVNFVVVDERVRFDVAMAPVRRSDLRVSALMLTAARDVARSAR